MRHEHIAGYRLKLYSIAAHADTARPELVNEVLRRAPAIFPAPAHAEHRHGVGFISVHARTESGALHYGRAALRARCTTGALYYRWQSDVARYLDRRLDTEV